MPEHDSTPDSPSLRGEFDVDGIHYIVRGETSIGPATSGLRRWNLLRRVGDGGAMLESYVHLPPTATVEDAKQRLLG